LFTVVLTGHIGSGKSSIGRLLQKEFGCTHIDIVEIKSGVTHLETLTNLFSQVMNSLFKGQSCVIEVVGNIDGTEILIEKINNLWVPCYQFELYRLSLERTMQSIKQRGNKLKGLEIRQVKQAWGTIWNDEARYLNSEDLETCLQRIKEEIVSGNSRNYIHGRKMGKDY